MMKLKMNRYSKFRALFIRILDHFADQWMHSEYYQPKQHKAIREFIGWIREGRPKEYVKPARQKASPK